MVIQEVSDLLGEYMLAGWILSDKSCEEDNIPLMKDKKTGEYLCVSCDIIKKDAKSPSGVVSLSSADTSPVIVDAAITDDAEDEEMWESFTPTPKPHQEQSDRAASLISQKLLTGWALLAESCQTASCYAVPLMRKRGEIPMQCVICEKLWQHGPKGTIVSYPSSRNVASATGKRDSVLISESAAATHVQSKDNLPSDSPKPSHTQHPSHQSQKILAARTPQTSAKSIVHSNLSRSKESMQMSIVNLAHQLLERIEDENLSDSDCEALNRNLLNPISQCLLVCNEKSDLLLRVEVVLSECQLMVSERLKELTKSIVDATACRRIHHLITIFESLSKISTLLQEL